MLNSIKVFLDSINWVVILISLLANIVLIISFYQSISSWLRKRRLFKIKKNQERLCAFSIGLGKNDPYQAVVDYMGEQNKECTGKTFKS